MNDTGIAKILFLLSRISAEALLTELYLQLPKGASRSELPDLTHCHKVSDATLLDALLIEETESTNREDHWMDLQCKMNALRFRVAQINMLAHISSLFQLSADARSGAGIEALQTAEKIFKEDLESLLDNYNTLLPNILVIPSAIGLHLLPVHSSGCHFFEPYSRSRCNRKSSRNSTFCEEHHDEIWWTFDAVTSRTATMLQYYSKPLQDILTEDEMSESIGRFFSQLGQQQNDYSAIEISAALKNYGYESERALQKDGRKALRKIFLQRIKTLHPDVGGNRQNFLETRRNYEVLLSQLE